MNKNVKQVDAVRVYGKVYASATHAARRWVDSTMEKIWLHDNRTWRTDARAARCRDWRWDKKKHARYMRMVLPYFQARCSDK